MQATYSPEDNKLRLSSPSRLDADTYARVKAAGFQWAPKQGTFVAPMWTPSRADLCEELAGEIGDEDSTLVERAEQRADRFDGYQANRLRDAEQSAAYVDRLTGGDTSGIMGHHSAATAARTAKRIEAGMARTVQFWDTAEYWVRRAAAALRHADRKEDPAVRYRRIKGLEADLRKQEKDIAGHIEGIRLWSLVPRREWDAQTRLATYIAGRECYGPGLYTALHDGRMHGDTAWRKAVEWHERAQAWPRRWADHYRLRIAYERAMLGESPAVKWDIEVGGVVTVGGEPCTVLRVTRKDGEIVSVRTSRRYCSLVGIEDVQGYEPPTAEHAAAVAAAVKPPPLLNYPAPDCVTMTQAEYAAIYTDHKGGRKMPATDTAVAHRLRHVDAFIARKHGSASKDQWGMVPVFLSDAKRTDPPAPGAEVAKPKARAPWRAPALAGPEASPVAAKVEQMRATIDGGGVVAVAAPQLFPTPPELAARMVDDARLDPGARVLEPSAGTGRILDAIDAAGRGANVTAVEVVPALCDRLRHRADPPAVVCMDFLSTRQLPEYDAVLMNPPFAGGADVAHVTHALGFLKPGGRLVAVMSSAVTFREDRAYREFRERLEELGGVIEPLPPGTFEGSGTGVNTVLVSVTADHEAAAPTLGPVHDSTGRLMASVGPLA